MKRILYSEYTPAKGTLIDVQNPKNYVKNPTNYSINIYADRLLFNYDKLLDKTKAYYIICNKGSLSQKVVAILEFYGYNVTQVIKNSI